MDASTMLPLTCCVPFEDVVARPVASLLMLQITSQAHCGQPTSCTAWKHILLQHHAVLQEEQAQTDSLAAERDSLQGEANRHRIRVSPAGSLKDCCFREVP